MIEKSAESLAVAARHQHKGRLFEAKQSKNKQRYKFLQERHNKIGRYDNMFRYSSMTFPAND